MPHRKPAPTARPRHAGPVACGPSAAALPWAERRFAAALFIILSLAAVLRTVGVVQYICHSPLARCPLIDASVYWNWAGDIAAGKSAQAAPFFSAPLYPYLLGVLRALGGSLPAVYVLQTLADWLTASGRYGEARAELTSVLQVAPESFEAQHSLGLIAAQSGDLNEARARLWQAVQGDPRSVKALHDLAVVVFQQGRPDEAAEYLRQALILDPTDQQVRAALQEIEQLPATRPNTP
jgi:tetratricopeptide (TPR) repeat protein